jgi:hypothetical protein
MITRQYLVEMVLFQYGMVLFGSHIFQKLVSLLFKIETSKSRNSLVLVSVVFLGLILVSNRSLWVSLWSSKRSYLVSFRSILGLAQGETKARPRRKTQTRPSRPQLDPKETHSRPKGDLFATIKGLQQGSTAGQNNKKAQRGPKGLFGQTDNDIGGGIYGREYIW